jgi:uncharacterized protein YfaS (alpha-2-macroglobulin family)
MKPSLRHFLLAALVALLFFSCKPRKYELSATADFGSEVELRQNLQFRFNKDVYPDSLLQVWDSTEYISFTPAVKGMFKWNSPSELSFSPASGFAPGTNYQAVVNKNIQRYSKKKRSMDAKQTFTFHTAPLFISLANASWTHNQTMAGIMVQLDLHFNYSVNTGDIIKHMKLNSQGKPVNYTVLSSGRQNEMSVLFMPINEKDENTPLSITLTKGIPVPGSDYTTASDTTLQISIPSRYKMEITGISSNHSGTEGVVTVNTSQPILEDGLKSFISLSPAVPFELTVNDAGFTITSTAMKADQKYGLTISNKISGIFGGRLEQDYTADVLFAKLQPQVTFMNSKGLYLSSQGYRNVALSIVNVPNVSVSVSKVYENNLEAFMRRGRDYSYGSSSEFPDGGEYEYYDTDDLGDTLFYQEYNTSKLPAQNAARVLHLDFKDKIRDFKGVYIVKVASKDHYWVQDSKIISLSDIGLIVKEAGEDVYVFSNSIKTTNALPGVKVSLVSSTNQTFATATTDAMGVAVFKNIRKNQPQFSLAMVTAKWQDEFNFIWLNRASVETSRFDVGGRMPDPTGMNAWIYAERSLYRPGETIHASTVVRTESWGLPGEIPVKLKLVMPNGKALANIRKILNEQGSCEAAFSLPASAPTGTYELEVYSGNDVLLNSYDFSIEDFMPDRIRAEVKTDREEYQPLDSVKATIQANNLFGTPATNRNYDCDLYMRKVDFSNPALSQYNFSITNDFQFQPVFRTGKTDETGAAREVFELPADLAEAGMLKGSIATSVYDETGRPVHRFKSFITYTQPYFLGIKSFDHYVGTKAPMRINIVAANAKGALLTNATARMVILKKEWQNLIEQDGNSYKYVSQQSTRTVLQQNITVNGANTIFSYTPQLSGEYEIRISLPDRNSFVSETFYAWGWGDTQYNSFDVNNEGNVTIQTDKEKYQSGERIRTLFTTPFEGKLLVTVERNQLIQHFYLATKNKSAALDILTNDEFLPNVYISATLFRPMNDAGIPLTVAHGFRPVMVENVKNRLPLSVSLAAKSRSKTKQTITVKTAPGAYVTVAAVDEGILQIKNYKTPQPYQYFFQKAALAVNSYDIYPWLLPEISTRRSSTGGDGGDDSNSMRVNPMFVNRVKNVSYWSGILQADGSGTVRYEVDLPQFSGDLRVMAVAYKNAAFAGTDQHMTVADPVVISTALPRFLSPGDEVVMPVMLSNTTAQPITATATVAVSGPLSTSGGNSRQVTIPAGREQRVVFNVLASQTIGACKVTVSVKTPGETFTNETEIGIRPPASLQKRTGNGIAAENQTTTINLNSNFMPGTAKGKLLVGKSPLVQYARNIDDLVQYPYGCVEQTTSTAFPQLYYADLVKSMYGHDNKDINPAYNVQQAILKLQSMQLSNGALSYWPDHYSSESWWGTVYATHFLLEARKAGYEVNPETLKLLLQYLKTRLQKKETETYVYNRNQVKNIAPKEVAYSLYVLALAGQQQVPVMNYYKANPELLSLDSKYMLAAAYALSGQQAQARQVLPPAFANETAQTATGGSFYSLIRDQAMALNALLDIDPNNPQAAALARQVSMALTDQPYLSTQEKIFSILALGKVARTANQTTATAAVLLDGKAAGTNNGSGILLNWKPTGINTVQVQVKGKGAYYYFWETSGITADGSYKKEDSYLKVRRSYYNREGKAIAGNTFKQNDLVVIKITLTKQYKGKVNNIVITDMLPAGLEIENPRLSEVPGMEWVKDNTTPEYIDFRDDRINLFTSIGDYDQHFYYMVRAVSPGTYKQGPVQADAMYNGALHSYYGAGTIKVTE